MAHTLTHNSLIKDILHKSLAEGVYREIINKNSIYYYFLGKTVKWNNDDTVPYPTDDYVYERNVRKEIITLKQIKPNDISFVIPRSINGFSLDWKSGTVYDMYDDNYSDKVIGLNIISGGTGYITPPTITISGGGGEGAEYTAVIDSGSGQLVNTDMISAGSGYTSIPTVTISGGGGSGAVISAVVNISASGSQTLETCTFYVITDEYNVYKCLDNNNNAKSTVMPQGTQIDPIKLSDGYIWKFMYNIPIGLRNKFLTSFQMPVTSALTEQFYNNGTLSTINILNKGSGYTSATILVEGDGWLEKDPIYVEGVTAVDGGSGFTSTPTITFSDPVKGAVAFNSGSPTFLSQKIFTTNLDFYEVIKAGALGLNEPTHTDGMVTNGSAVLKYIGSTIKGTVSLLGDSISSINLIGSLREVVLDVGGSGYTSAPSVTITGGGGSGAQAVAKMHNGTVLYITVTNQGEGYTSIPSVIIGTEWTANTSVSLLQQIWTGDRLYTVTTAGTTGTTAPTGTGSAITNGTAVLSYAGRPASATAIRKFGCGYTTSPKITITGTRTTEPEFAIYTSLSDAKLIPVIENGQLSSIIVDNPGVGYTYATLTVVSDGGGTGAEISPNLNIGNIDSLQANNEMLTVAGTIDAIKVVSSGYNYGSASVIIEGDGTGARAVAEIDSVTGGIKKIVMTSRGSGYTYANIEITGSGHAATARAIMSPYGGHGKNSPEELYAKTIMFYGNVSTDLNQGFEVNNDYRQVGIIKNPRYYNNTNIYNNIIGSCCFAVEASINTLHFPKDSLVYVTRAVTKTSGSTDITVNVEKSYRVITSTSSSILLQSLDNDTPLPNDTFKNADLQTFVVSTVGAPTVDKYSGQMMFIDNKSGFTPSAAETVTLRTVIKF